MRLTINGFLDDNKARLEYSNSPSKPRFAPAYVISGERADEFVKKYNKQSETLIKNSILMTFLGLIAGAGMGLSGKFTKLSLLVKSGIGAATGLLLGMVISKHEKNKLMDEYHVEEY